mmetsp:Transcript_12554/g.46918  ORF Transcript_12554/g.46918 Transcript_12554/m.46918 type:complete len:227 (-) Transcript_12554:644-1324(-)
MNRSAATSRTGMNPFAPCWTCSRKSTPFGLTLTATESTARITSKSRVTVSRIPGRCTFTATSPPNDCSSPTPCPYPPFFSFARYTWPIDAAATGVSKHLTSSNTSAKSTSPPSSSCCRISARASSLLNGATLSSNVCNCVRYAGGIKSGRIASAWPTFTNAGPCCAIKSFNSVARFIEFLSTVSGPAATSPSKPTPQVTNLTTKFPVRLKLASGRVLQYARMPSMS